MSDWIDVKDRLPDGNGAYAVCWRDKHNRWQAGIAKFAYSNISGEFKDAKSEPVFFAYEHGKNIKQYTKVEFWLTLPEPPEVKEKCKNNHR